MSARAGSIAGDKEGDGEETDSIVIDTSDLDSLNAEQIDEVMENAAEEYANKYLAESKERKIDYDKYHFSVAQKYDLTNRRLTWKKYKYIADELFLDLRLRLWRTITWQTSMFILVFLYFLRMFFHYTMQYFLLIALGVPVTKFRPNWHRIDLEYASWTFAQEALVVSMGIMANTIVFLLLDGLTVLCRKWCKCFPK